MSLIGRALVFKPKCLKLEPSCGHFPKWLQFLNMRKNSLNSTFLKNFPTLFSLDCFLTLYDYIRNQSANVLHAIHVFTKFHCINAMIL